MLHILGLVLKFLLLLPGVVLGLLLLVLFVPFRYRGSLKKDADGLYLQGNISFLFRMLSFWIYYEEGKPRQTLKLFGVPLKRKKKKKRKKRRTESAPQKPPQTKEEPPAQREAQIQTRAEPLHTEIKETEIPQKEETPRGVFRKIGRLFRAAGRLLKKLFLAAAGLLYRFIMLPVTLLKAIQRVVQGAFRFRVTLSNLRSFFSDEQFCGALRLVLGESKHLLGHLLPQRIEGAVRFGAEDPSMVGQLLAVLGMTYPLHKNRVQVTPVFGETVFEGELRFGGRVRLSVLVRILGKLYFDENIKEMYHKCKRKEG